MFQNLRKGAPLYVLHKNNLELEFGEIINVTPPQPIYNHGYQNGQYLPPKMGVDIQVSINGNNVNLQKVPADLSVADDNGMILSETREAILTELDIIKKESQKIVDSRDFHAERVAKCDALAEELNPNLKKEAEQAKEINDLKQQVNDLSAGLGDIKTMLSEVLCKK